MKPIIATSIPPKLVRKLPNGQDIGTAYQQQCIESWSSSGFSVCSLNPLGEIDIIKASFNGSSVVPVERDARATFGRPLIWMEDLLGFLSDTSSDVVGIVNSDVLVELSPEQFKATLELAQDGVVAYNRMEVAYPSQRVGPLYRYGFDLFLFPRRIIPTLRMAGFPLGAPWWDYWLLLNAALEDHAVSVIHSYSAKHLTHPNNWNVRSWEKTAAIVSSHLRQYRASLCLSGAREATGGPAEFLLNTADLLLGTLKFDQTATFLAPALGHGLGTLLGLFTVKTVERTALRFHGTRGGHHGNEATSTSLLRRA